MLVSAEHSVEGSVLGVWSSGFVQGGGGPGYRADDFGEFDTYLKDGTGSATPEIIGPGEYIEFTFTITGTGVLDTDFISELSNQFDNNKLAFGAAKFFDGDDESAYGAYIPEPAALSLLALGSLALLKKRKV